MSELRGESAPFVRIVASFAFAFLLIGAVDAQVIEPGLYTLNYSASYSSGGVGMTDNDQIRGLLENDPFSSSDTASAASPPTHEPAIRSHSEILSPEFSRCAHRIGRQLTIPDRAARMW